MAYAYYSVLAEVFCGYAGQQVEMVAYYEVRLKGAYGRRYLIQPYFFEYLIISFAHVSVSDA